MFIFVLMYNQLVSKKTDKLKIWYIAYEMRSFGVSKQNYYFLHRETATKKAPRKERRREIKIKKDNNDNGVMITGVFFSFLTPPARWWRRRRRRRRDSVHLNRRRGYSLCSVCQCCIQRGRRGERERERERATHGHINPARLETCTHTHARTHGERNAIGSALISAASPPDRGAPFVAGLQEQNLEAGLADRQERRRKEGREKKGEKDVI